MNTDPWPYPRWIAHRGAGRLAPENTLAAFRLGARHGYRMFECDAQLSSDGLPFLLHDATLERSTNAVLALGQGASRVAGDHAWSALSQLDAGAWHSRQYAGEPLPTLENLARYCLANGFFLNVEIKPTPGLEERTGQRVGELADRLWRAQATPPLLSSFQIEALAGARAAAAQIPRALLIDTVWDDCLACALQLGCVAIVARHTLWDAALLAQVRGLGLRALGYTVNDERDAQRLIALGVDALITDRVDLFAPTL